MMAVRKGSRHKHRRVSQRQVRVSARKAAPKYGIKTIQVKRAVSLRGRTHEMEAALPGMPQVPQDILMESTAIRKFKYYIKEKRLRIWWVKKGVYDYYDVPESVVIRFARAPSKGRFAYYNIRTSYDYKRII